MELSPENSGLRTIRYKTAFENADGERWFAWNELKALFEPVDVQEEEIWIWYEEDCWPRDYDDDTVQYLNFTRQEVIFDPELEQVTLHFGNDAVYTVALGEERRFRLGCVTEPDQELRAALGDQTGEAEVVDFTGDPRFEAVGTLTLRSEKQYLYLWEDGVFTLLDDKQNICVVGDDDQGLYRFRGATIRNILEFPRRFPEGRCAVHTLTVNYRSDPGIITFFITTG